MLLPQNAHALANKAAWGGIISHLGQVLKTSRREYTRLLEVCGRQGVAAARLGKQVESRGSRKQVHFGGDCNLNST